MLIWLLGRNKDLIISGGFNIFPKEIELVIDQTTEFLEWLKEAGNDLITPHPEFGFPGLKDGDGWCVCASWYARAVDAGKGCPIYLKRTHENTLKILPIETLKKFAIDLS